MESYSLKINTYNCISHYKFYLNRNFFNFVIFSPKPVANKTFNFAHFSIILYKLFTNKKIEQSILVKSNNYIRTKSKNFISFYF